MPTSRPTRGGVIAAGALAAVACVAMPPVLNAVAADPCAEVNVDGLDAVGLTGDPVGVVYLDDDGRIVGHADSEESFEPVLPPGCPTPNSHGG